jgi:hypothetical protein
MTRGGFGTTVAAGLVAAGLLALGTGLARSRGDFAASDDGALEPIVVVSPRVVDFGTLNVGDVRTFAFELRNVGAKEARLLRAWTSCGCTVLDEGSATLPPNGSYVLRGALDTNVSGPKRARVTAEMDRPLRVVDVGDVVFAVRSGWYVPRNPTLLDFSNGAIEAPPITATADDDVDMTTARASVDPVVGLELETSVAGRSLRLRPVADPRLLPLGAYSLFATLRSDSRNVPEFRLRLDVVRDPARVDLSPAVPSVFGVGPDGVRRATFRVVVDGVRARPRRATSLTPELRIVATTFDDDGGCALDVETPGRGNETVRAQVLVETDAARVVAPVLVGGDA